MSKACDHWQSAWAKNPDSKSWVQQRPDLSLAMITACQLAPNSAILDMGGGASTLVDFLLADGYCNLTIVDISANALQLAQTRLGPKAKQLNWIADDACQWQPDQKFDLWHDRAVFHFLTDAADRAAYKKRLYDAVPVGGFLVMASFALDGPTVCSGLPVIGYDGDHMAAEIGSGFRLLEAQSDTHITPLAHQQQFQYCRFLRV